MIDKEFLRIHAERRNELEDELRRYDQMNGASYYRSPASNDGMPHSSGGISDPTADAVIKPLDLSKQLDKLRKLIWVEEEAIETVLAKLPKANQKTVIRIKYFQRYDWDDVALFMYGDKMDYARNTEKYKKKALNIHGTALANMKRVQEAEGGKT